MHTRRPAAAGVTLVLSVLAACGGGGGDPVPAAAVPAATAVLAAQQTAPTPQQPQQPAPAPAAPPAPLQAPAPPPAAPAPPAPPAAFGNAACERLLVLDGQVQEREAFRRSLAFQWPVLYVMAEGGASLQEVFHDPQWLVANATGLQGFIDHGSVVLEGGVVRYWRAERAAPGAVATAVTEAVVGPAGVVRYAVTAGVGRVVRRVECAGELTRG